MQLKAMQQLQMIQNKFMYPALVFMASSLRRTLVLNNFMLQFSRKGAKALSTALNTFFFAALRAVFFAPG